MKRRNNRGFTLIEMLIVVGIIAILVAVSIPMVNSSLEKAREATDMANERAAIAEATIEYLNDQISGKVAARQYYFYNAEKGALVPFDSSTEITPYGKCKDHKNAVLWVTVIDDGTPYIMWMNSGSSGDDPDPEPHLKGHDYTLVDPGSGGSSTP